MYTLHYTIGVNWDIYVPWTGKGLNSERHIDNIIKCPDYRERCHHFGRGASGEEFHLQSGRAHTYISVHSFFYAFKRCHSNIAIGTTVSETRFPHIYV